jgi:ubiquinone biosynthesis protein
MGTAVSRQPEQLPNGRGTAFSSNVLRLAHMRRYSEIAATLVRYGFVDVVRALHLTPSLNAGRRLASALGRGAPAHNSRARRLRLALETLGPTFIKFG